VNGELREFRIFHHPESNIFALLHFLQDSWHSWIHAVTTLLTSFFIPLIHCLGCSSEKLKAQHTQRTLQSKTLNQPGLWTPLSSLSPFLRPFTSQHVLSFSFCSLAPLLFCKSGPMLSDVFGKDHHPWQHLFTSRLYLIMQASSIIEKWILTRKKIDCLAVLWHLFSEIVTRKIWACPKEQAQFWVVGLFGISLHQEYIQHHISMMCSRLHNNHNWNFKANRTDLNETFTTPWWCHPFH